MKKASPDDDYLPATEPDTPDWQVREPGEAHDGLGPEAVELAERSRKIRDRKDQWYGSGTDGKPAGFDGRISTALGSLTPEEFNRARREGKLNKNGDLSVRPPGISTKKKVGRSLYTTALTLEEYLAAQDLRKQAEEEAQATATARRELALLPPETGPVSTTTLRFERWMPGWIRPTVLSYEPEDEETGEAAIRAEEEAAAGDYDPWDLVDDQYAAAYWATEGEDPDDRVDWQKQADEDSERQRNAERVSEATAAVAASWQAEIAARRATGDQRFAPDPTCGNPHGCPNPPKPGGNRCPACYEHRRKNPGDERPLRLINRAKRRKAS
ncbi:MAG TPA: hypothetical protein VMU76_11290 [Acidimicrobiales bacterium]|nr:hypothetical protein [Acidimicrobiales bacterium]